MAKISHLKLLQLASPKATKETMNLLIDLYNNIDAEIREIADTANSASQSALVHSNQAKTDAAQAKTDASQALQNSNIAIDTVTAKITEANTVLQSIDTLAKDLEYKVATDYYRGPQGPKGESDYNNLSNRPAKFLGTVYYDSSKETYDDIEELKFVPTRNTEDCNVFVIIEDTQYYKATYLCMLTYTQHIFFPVQYLHDFTHNKTYSRQYTEGAWTLFSEVPVYATNAQFLGLREPAYYLDYNNFTNTPEIPDVSNFITKDVDDLINYTLSTGVGSKLNLSIDPSTYVMTLSLTNATGTVLDTKTVDLPLETMVVNASYNNSTKQITLTLQNGTTTSFSVADLVSGLANTSDLENYLPLTAGSGKALTGLLALSASSSSVWDSTTGLNFGASNTGANANRTGELGIQSDKGIYFRVGGTTHSIMNSSTYSPVSDNSIALGNSSYKWKEIHGTTIYQNGKKVLDTGGGQTLEASLHIKTASGGSIFDGQYRILDDNGAVVARIGSNPKGQVGFQTNVDTSATASDAAASFSFRTGSTTRLRMFNDTMRPEATNQYNLGTSAIQFNNIYGKTLYQDGKQVANNEDIPKIVTLTQTEYDALATKDSNTYYFIKEG